MKASSDKKVRKREEELKKLQKKMSLEKKKD